MEITEIIIFFVTNTINKDYILCKIHKLKEKHRIDDMNRLMYVN